MNVFTDNNPIRQMIAVWVDHSRPVTRRTYLVHGVLLAAVKYVGDAVLVFTALGAWWTPADYVHGLPALVVEAQSDYADSWALVPALALWMMPFVAVGVTLTARRASDAGRSPWLAILFLVPYLNYALIAVLSALPSRRRAHVASVRLSGLSETTVTILASGAGFLVAGVAVIVGLSAIGSYGAWLFVLAPFAMGALTAFIYNRGRQVTGSTRRVVVMTVAAAGALLLVTGVEGLICILMALPLVLPLALAGALVGRWAAASDGEQKSSAMLMLLALPLTAGIEPPSGVTVHEVRSSVIIDAPPDAVWPHVVSFSALAEPADWLFRAGVAYPVSAHIQGSGVGAVRYCVFSTGSFVEPITHWEPGRRLSFDVVASPATMRELSPYSNLSPPHLHGYFRSRRGEFRFVDLGDGRTRLEGSTWYELEMAPEAYWRIIADALIHRIHNRVLDHIRREVEQRPSPPEHQDSAGLSQAAPEKSREHPSVEELERRNPRAVVTAGEDGDFVWNPAPAELGHEHARQVHGKRQIVPGVDEERTDGAGAGAVQVRPRADRPPQLAQPIHIHVPVEPLPHVPGGQAAPDDIGKPRRDVIERLRPDTRLVGRRQHRQARSEARAQNADALEAL